MKPATFDYVRPTTVEEAVAALAAAGGEAKPLAGGQSLVALMNLRLARPAVVVDLGRVAGLSTIETAGDELTIGAMVRHRRLVEDPLVRRHAPLLAEAARHIGHGAIRNRGTIGGSLAHADPAAELPVVCSALDAEVTVAGPNGARRRVPVTQLFTGPLSTALAEDELLVAVHVHRDHGARDWGFAEIARRHGDFALVLAAATVTVDGDGRCFQAAIAVGGVAPTPLRLGEAARVLIGTRLDDEAIEAAAEATAAQIRPGDDLHASAAYRRAMAAELVRRALRHARGGR